MKKTSFHRVSKTPLSVMRKKCDAEMQRVGKVKFPRSIISGLPTDVMHHYIPKSCSSVLRYDWDNLVPLTTEEHCRLHQSPDPTNNNLILAAKGMEWFNQLKIKSRAYNKVNRQYYEQILIRLQNENPEDSTIG